METGQRRRALLRPLAWVGVALVLAITTLSAFIRLQLALHESADVGAARIAHRSVASAALLLFIALALLLHWPPAAPKSSGRLAVAIVALALFLAVLGAAAGPSHSAPVVMGNLLAGFAMFALALRLALSLAGAPEPQPFPAQLLATGAVLLLVAAQAALGAALVASQEATRCGESLLCHAHRAIGIVTLFAAAAWTLIAWRRGGVAARALLPLALVQGALGVAMIRWSVPLPLAVAHNTVAALLAATLVAVLPQRKS